MTYKWDEVDWSWSGYAVGRVRREAPPEPPEQVPVAGLGAPSFQFRRPTWQWAVMVLTPVWFMVPIARGGDRRGRRIARADVVEIRRTRGDLAIIVRDAASATLAPAGKPHRAAIELGGRLALALAVPFVDETGAAATLPIARVVRSTT